MTVVCYTSYSQAIDDAHERMKKGQRQLYCWTCRLWKWPDQCDHEGKSTQREFNRLVRLAAKQTRERYPTAEQKYVRAVRAARKRGEL